MDLTGLLHWIEGDKDDLCRGVGCRDDRIGGGASPLSILGMAGRQEVRLNASTRTAHSAIADRGITDTPVRSRD